MRRRPVTSLTSRDTHYTQGARSLRTQQCTEKPTSNPTMTFHAPTCGSSTSPTGPMTDNLMSAFHPLEQPLRDARPELALGNPQPTLSRWVDSGCQRLLRKEVIQPHLPVRLPCYDFVPIASPTFDGSLPEVGPPASGVTDFRDVTGGVYKARERIHRSIADLRLLATPTSRGRVADPDPN